MRLAEVRLKNNVYPVTAPTQLPSLHRLGPRDMPVKLKRCRHVAVAIPIVAIGGVVAMGSCQQSPQPQQPDVAYHQTLIGWRGR
jgi:hypothetical protein